MRLNLCQPRFRLSLRAGKDFQLVAMLLEFMKFLLMLPKRNPMTN